MALKGMIAAGMMAASVAFMSPGAAEAKTNVTIGIGNGWGGPCWNAGYYNCGWRPRHYYYNHRYRPHYNNYYSYYDDRIYYPQTYHRVSCGRAKDILLNHGYRKIVARDCAGSTYTFRARKNGHIYAVSVSARSGRIVGVSRI